MNQNNDKTRYYLAYGSNLNSDVFRQFAKEGRRVGVGSIPGYQLRYRGVGDGQAYLTIEPERNHYVPVAVYEITSKDVTALDGYEGYPDLYEKKSFLIEATIDGKPRQIQAFAYVMRDDFPYCLPASEYVERVSRGYDECGFEKYHLDEAHKQTWTRLRK